MILFRKICLFALQIYTFSIHACTNPLFVLTIPKSGTFLTAKAIAMLTDIPIEENPMDHSLFNETFLIQHPNIKTTAHLVSEFEPLRLNTEVKKIIVIRDLRDVCVSATFWLKDNDWYSWAIDHTPFYNMNFEERLSYMIDIKHEQFSIKSFAKRVFQWMRTPGVLTIRFEDLVGEKGGGSKELQLKALKAIADYLEVNVNEDRFEYVADNLWGQSHTFRKGKIHSWKESFTEENKILFKRVLGNELIELGYENNNQW